jgi:glyoxylate reductase
MSPAAVFVTRRIPEPGLARLKEAGVTFEVFAEDRPPTRAELLRAAAGRRGLLCMLSERVDAELFDAAGPSLRGVANCAVGYNNVDLAEATRRGIPISNTPDVLTDATADLAWALLLAVARRVCEGDRMVRAGAFHGWAPQMLLGVDLVGKTLGIAGAGRIGTALARRSRGWDMRVLYADTAPNTALEQELGAQRVELPVLCRESDFISVHVPLSDATHHLFGSEQFGLMKPTAIFVNTARGPIHDEAALAAALRAGQIAGAGLDVYENEPNAHADLLGMENVVLLPHLGSATTETRAKMALMAANNMIAMLEERRPPNLVNFDLFKGTVGPI